MIMITITIAILITNNSENSEQAKLWSFAAPEARTPLETPNIPNTQRPPRRPPSPTHESNAVCQETQRMKQLQRDPVAEEPYSTSEN